MYSPHLYTNQPLTHHVDSSTDFGHAATKTSRWRHRNYAGYSFYDRAYFVVTSMDADTGSQPAGVEENE